MSRAADSLCAMHLSLWESAVRQHEQKAASLHSVAHTLTKTEVIKKGYQMETGNGEVFSTVKKMMQQFSH